MGKKKEDEPDLRFDPREELGLDPACTFDVHIAEDGVGPKSDDGPAPDDPDVIDLGQPPDYAYYSREDPTAYDVKPLGPKKELRRNKDGLIMPDPDPRFPEEGPDCETKEVGGHTIYKLSLIHI